MADPKKTGVKSPECTASKSRSAPAASSSSSSSTARSSKSFSTSSRRAGSSKDNLRSVACWPRPARLNNITSRERRSMTPRNCSPLPMGQFTAQGMRPSSDSISSSKLSGSRQGRSILLMKVKIGICRIRQTSNNLRVCGSRPLAASSSITALSAAARVRYVSSEKSWCPGVSSKLIVVVP